METWAMFLGIAYMWWTMGPALRRKATRMPEVWIALLASIVFCVFFARIGNVGLMVRQRLHALPAVLTLLAIPWLLRQEAIAGLQAERVHAGLDQPGRGKQDGTSGAPWMR